MLLLLVLGMLEVLVVLVVLEELVVFVGGIFERVKSRVARTRTRCRRNYMVSLQK